MERKQYQDSILERITQFINEGVEIRQFSIKHAARLHFEPVGSTTPLVPIAYVRFLKAMGIADPTMDDLCGHFIGRYWEFITQHHGTLAAEKAMEALRAFWISADMNGFIVHEPMPGDLSPGLKTAKPYRVKVTIKETK